MIPTTPSTIASDSEETLTFDSLPLSAELRQAVDELGYTQPTPVQRAVYEPALRGIDLVVQARTGTGKTAAFGLPLVDGMVRKSQAEVQALILCPTRELALQVHRELERLGKYKQLRSIAVYGGAPMAKQVQEIAGGAQIIVGTPGRVLDHLQRKSLDARSIRACILDESDEMLSMGFLPQINEIQSYLPVPHQTLLFSATLPADIQRMAETRLNNPTFLTLSGDHIGALEVQHLTYFSRNDKLEDLLRILEVEDPEGAIIFCNTRDETKRVAAALEKRSTAVQWLNADLAQSDREKAMQALREGNVRFLVCTDVAARGIDISHLTHVINYDFPESPEAYVHRTGRTGRAGRTGTAISLITPGDIGFLYMLRLTYKITPIERRLPSASELRTREQADLVEMLLDAFPPKQARADDLTLARRLLTHEAADTIVAGLIRSHLGDRVKANASSADIRRNRVPCSDASPVTAAASTPKVAAATSTAAASIPKVAAAASIPKVATVTSTVAAPIPTAAAKVTIPEAPNVTREPARNQAQFAMPPSRERPPPSNQTQTDDSGRRRRRRRADTADNYADEEFEFGYTARSIEDSPAAPLEQRANSPAETRTTVVKTEVAESIPSPDMSTGPATGEVVEVFLNVGKRDGIGAEDVTDVLGRVSVPVSHVSVRYHHTFVGVVRPYLDQALKALDGSSIGGRVARAEPARSNRP